MDYLKTCVNILRQLVAIPSVSGNEKQAALFVRNFLENELGMETELQYVTDTSCNVIGRWRASGASRLLVLGGHLDTVSPSKLWEIDPYMLTRVEDRLYGLGSADMKGGLAAQLTCLLMLKKQNIPLISDVEFIALADEEGLSSGAHMYASNFYGQQMSRKSFFILGEPHYDNIVIGATGKILIKCDIVGQSGHAAKPEQGVNAIDCMADFLAIVNHTYQAKYLKGECASHCCLMVDSHYTSYNLNIPEKCSCLINKQLLPTENATSFLENLKSIYSKNINQGELIITQELPNYPAYAISPEQEDLDKFLRILREKYDRTPKLEINQSVSDGNILYNNLNMPGILFGPYGANLHSHGEYVSMTSLSNYMNELFGYICEYYSE